MTKAERIFKDTFWDCRKYIKTWGVIVNANTGKVVGYDRLSTDDPVSTRTINDVEKWLKAQRKIVEMDIQYDIISTDEADLRKKALDMVEGTIENARAAL